MNRSEDAVLDGEDAQTEFPEVGPPDVTVRCLPHEAVEKLLPQLKTFLIEMKEVMGDMKIQALMQAKTGQVPRGIHALGERSS
jgi:hypothetical protein